MTLLIKIVAAVLVGIGLGLVITVRSLDHDSQAVIGPWHAAPRDNGGEVDPYALASIARAHVLPMGAAEGLSFTATTDSDGAPLTARCDVTIDGPMPPTRYWTMSVLDPAGFPIANPADRHGFTSAEVLRTMNKPVSMTVAKAARSGNWLPTGDADRYTLMLRLYDTGLSTIGATLESATMPSIKRIGCR